MSCAYSNAAARKKSEIGNPGLEENPGKPDDKLSDRGFGTELRTDPVFLGLQKTRLLDPVMSLPGTNDHPGDYRSSGCSACHVIYANDRDAAHSGSYAQFGHSGLQRLRSIPPFPKRIRPSHQTHFHPLHPLQPVHDLPSPPRHEHGHHLLRPHLVGQRNRWRQNVSARATQSHRRAALPVPSTQSRSRRRARPVERQ